MRVEGLPQLGATDVHMVVRGRRMRMTAMGQSFTTSMPPPARQRYDWSRTMSELARYVKQVRVRENRIVNGEPGVTVAGVIDTDGLLRAVSKMESFSQAVGQQAPDLSEITKHIGDTRAALFIARRSGLSRSAYLTVPVDADGTRLQLEITYRLESVNKAIAGL